MAARVAEIMRDEPPGEPAPAEAAGHSGVAGDELENELAAILAGLAPAATAPDAGTAAPVVAAEVAPAVPPPPPPPQAPSRPPLPPIIVPAFQQHAAPLPVAMTQAAPAPIAPPAPIRTPAGAPSPGPAADTPSRALTAGASVSDSALLAAFMEGAGLPGVVPEDPVTAMRNAGAAFRALSSGLREALMVRAETKNAMRIDQTMIRARGNNPLKFSVSDEDALTALLGTGRRVDMTPAQAVAEALRDLRHHEQASLPATQAALRALLDRLHPDIFRAAGESSGALLNVQRRARAFAAFAAAWRRLGAELTDDFETAFGKTFAAAYQAIVADLRRTEAAEARDRATEQTPARPGSQWPGTL